MVAAGLGSDPVKLTVGVIGPVIWLLAVGGFLDRTRSLLGWYLVD